MHSCTSMHGVPTQREYFDPIILNLNFYMIYIRLTVKTRNDRHSVFYNRTLAASKQTTLGGWVRGRWLLSCLDWSVRLSTLAVATPPFHPMMSMSGLVIEQHRKGVAKVRGSREWKQLAVISVRLSSCLKSLPCSVTVASHQWTYRWTSTWNNIHFWTCIPPTCVFEERLVSTKGARKSISNSLTLEY